MTSIRPDEALGAVSVRIVSALPDAVDERLVRIATGDGSGAPAATVADALRGAGIEHDGEVGIWGKRVALDTPLSDGDRIELYRPLIADPKQARHQRASAQGYRWQGRTRRAVRVAALAGADSENASATPPPVDSPDLPEPLASG